MTLKIPVSVQVFGYGVIGRVFTQALSHSFVDSKVFDHINIYDINKEKFELFKEDVHENISFPRKNVFWGVPPNSDFYFICTHEDNVMGVIEENKLYERDGLTIIRSTVPPKATKEIMELFNFHVCHNPEFINGKKTPEQELYPRRVVIGECCKEHGDILYDLYKKIMVDGFDRYYRMNTTESELTKLFANANLSIQLTMWNEFYRLVENLNGNYLCMDKIADAVCSDPRMSKHRPYKWGRGWGGHCLPKDFKALIQSYLENCIGVPRMLMDIYGSNDSLEVYV